MSLFEDEATDFTPEQFEYLRKMTLNMRPFLFEMKSTERTHDWMRKYVCGDFRADAIAKEIEQVWVKEAHYWPVWDERYLRFPRFDPTRLPQ